jgi:AcrR family transcriptional regulator
MNAVLNKQPRTKPSNVRREELLLSAERLFVEQGVTATSVDDIVAGAAVAKGTFYLYFASKDEMLAALREKYGESGRARMEEAMAECAAGDWLGKIDAWVAAGVNAYLDHLRLHDVLFHQAGHHPRRSATKSDNQMVAALAELIADGNRARAWSVDDPRMTAMLLFHALHGAVDHAIARGETDARQALIDVLRKFYRRALGATALQVKKAKARRKT